MNEFEQIIKEGSAQRTDNWHEMRRGRFTSSEFQKLLTKPQSKEYGAAHEGFGKTAVSYIESKAMEIYTGQDLSADIGDMWAVKWGRIFEPSAVKLYEMIHGDTVEETGFYPYGDNAGGSPDFKSRKVGIGEIKCPQSRSIHSDYLLNIPSMEYLRDVNPTYWTQLQCNMHFTGIDVGCFISFDPRYFTQAMTGVDPEGFSPQYAFESSTDMEKKLGLHVVIGEKDPEFGRQIDDVLSRAVAMRDRILKQITERFGEYIIPQSEGE